MGNDKTFLEAVNSRRVSVALTIRSNLIRAGVLDPSELGFLEALKAMDLYDLMEILAYSHDLREKALAVAESLKAIWKGLEGREDIGKSAE